MLSDLRATDSSSAIGALAQVLAGEGCVPEAAAFTEAVMKRETVCSTVFPPCWALPHARIKAISRVTLALGRLQKPIKWGAEDLPVRLIFLFAVPENDTVTYMSIISALARLNADARATESLLNAADPLAVLAQVPLRRPRPSRS